MKAAFELAGEPRAQLGRTSARRLRKAGKVPAVMYGGGEAPESLVLDHNSLKHQMTREAFYTSILTLKLGTKAQQVVVKAVERHPARPIIMHMDFQRVREDVEITLNVPIHFLNEAESKGVKDQGGVVNHVLTDVEVRCLPRYLPEYLEIDLTALELNQMFHLSDIKLPEGVTLVALAHGDDQPLVAVNPPREEEIEIPVETAAAAGEVPATAQAEPAAEGDAAADGKDKDAKGGGGKAKGGKDKD
ncbi:MAG: 50S ribosomal protein L25/general stress protein Ctc [Gammaproteobacteria bacterium]